MGSTSSTAGVMAVALLCVAAVTGCADSGGGGSSVARSEARDGLAADASSPGVDRDEVSARSTSLGRILVDGAGRTLYLFEGDGKNTSTCTGPCAKIWPPLTVATRATAGGGGVEKSLLAIAVRADGARQVTYNGHPLYTFEDDHKPGDTNGQGDISFHHRWYVLDTAGNRNTTPQQDTGGLY
ncbi:MULTISPECIES: hypothetical protein [unclassified Streptomyces]|uniref:COG4315 family predicted lipoprotein n=1 Tax=unclassified Streptomyces TaxID=2593676 RepID=UPI00081E42D2|nr:MULTISPECIES: hypothetical protein [unclassified Streptomyces]MYZ33986.1 hypothetical protein [Streptomyces sp. SID4917]SCF63251.1 Predicted lipoprotein with conserved Yx(FWY)xxD motif [Streptomyces sp. MnatMP-M17]